jgi:uncharacterized protein
MTIQANVVDPPFFTPAVKPLLCRFDFFEQYDKIKGGSPRMHLGASEIAFIANRDWFYVAAMGQDGWPYTQRHRGPKGFLRVLGATSVGFASLAGSQRYISDGSALLFLIDHASHAQLKIWADAEVSEDPATMEKLVITRRGGPGEHVAFFFRVRGFDWGDKQHAMQRSAGEVHSTEAARPGKSDPLSTNAMTANRCLSLDAGSGGWTLNAHTVGSRSENDSYVAACSARLPITY